MNSQQIKIYRKNKDFQRNESIWVLSTIDHFNTEDIAKQFDISEDAINLIVELHQKYWDSTNI